MNKIQDDDVYNVDDTCIELNTTAKTTYASRGMVKIILREAGEWSSVTMICCGSASGASVPPMFVFKGKTLPHNILHGASQHSSCTCSESGKVTANVFLLWMQECIIPHIKRKNGPKVCDTLRKKNGDENGRKSDPHNQH